MGPSYGSVVWFREGKTAGDQLLHTEHSWKVAMVVHHLLDGVAKDLQLEEADTAPHLHLDGVANELGIAGVGLSVEVARQKARMLEDMDHIVLQEGFRCRHIYSITIDPHHLPEALHLSRVDDDVV